MSKELEQSLKDRVREIAKEQGRTFNDVWKTLVLERFLVRLSRSQYLNRLIFKGGMLLSKYLPLRRETVDLDFLAKGIRAEAAAIHEAISSVLQVPIEDGFTFASINVAEALQPHMDYQGYSVTAVARIGGTKTTISLDIGVGDVVEPQDKAIALTRTKARPVYEDAVSLKVYPPEFIFSEKLETIHYRGAMNSRMKDFYDLWRMVGSEGLLDSAKLGTAIRLTFEQRETPLNARIEFAEPEIARLEGAWRSFRAGLASAETVPVTLAEVLEGLNRRMLGVIPE